MSIVTFIHKEHELASIELSDGVIVSFDRAVIKAIAQINGFKLKQQDDGTLDLNPYVYQFAYRLISEFHDRFIRAQQFPKTKPRTSNLPSDD
jgi:hypothetical protein